ncbi:zinc finger family protein [Dorcoceras hygrometricum]|uniref:Zinc finger family protein n=1 Tax=Dorcoceras hygrometricum TaxID=472368 RepID=A0A2Z7CH70_9LAMI|nr:zinc finger family protein [Dorcoceras hygrometricum]
MEQQSSDPKLHVQEKELVSPVSGQEVVPADDKSLNKDTMDSPEESGEQKDEGDGDADSDLFARGWSKTGKRIRNSKARVKIPGFSQDEDASRPGDEAGEPGKQKLPLKKRKVGDSSDSDDTGDEHSDTLSGGSKIMEPGEPVTDPGADREVASTDNDNNEIIGEHVCNVCNRTFKSYQALGGHKAHHNSSEKAEDISFTEDKNESSRRPRKSEQVHQCPFCNKIFSKGQALGGHKRHCGGQASHGGEPEAENPPRMLDFDLNELPPEWVPED